MERAGRSRRCEHAEAVVVGEQQLGDVRAPRIIAQKGIELRVAPQRAGGSDLLLDGDGLELSEPQGGGALRRLAGRGDDGGRPGQDLRFVAPLAHVGGSQRRHARRDFATARVRQTVERAAGVLAAGHGDPDRERDRAR